MMVRTRRTVKRNSTILAHLFFVCVLAMAGNASAADVTVNAGNDSNNTTATTVVSLTAANDDYLVTTAAADTDLTHGTGNIALSGGTNTIIVEHADAGNASSVNVKVNGTLTNSAGTLTVRFVETGDTSAETVLLEVTGATSISGATAVETNGTTVNGAQSATLTLGGNATLTGAVSVNANSSGNAGSDAIINFNGTTNATGGVTLNSGNGQAILNFGHTAADATFSGVIDGAADNEGDVNVLNATRTITFASNIGASQDLLTLAIGDGTTAGNAAFTGTVDVSTITIVATAGDASADFNGVLTVGANDLTLDGGNDSSEDATATIAGNVLAENATSDIIMDDNTGTASVTFDGAAAQQIDTRIDGEAANEGAINISNSHASGVTFEADVGLNNAIKTITIGSADGTNSVATFTDHTDAQAIVLGNAGSTVDTAQMILESNDGALSVEGTVNGTTDTDTISVYDTTGGAAGNLVTFTGIVGGTTAIDTIAVGTTNHEGAVAFSANVSAAALTLTAGGAASETATASFASGTTATITAVTVTGGAADNSQDSTLTCTDCIGAITAITLDDDVGQATVAINNAADRAFGGTIDGAAAGEGALTINESDDTAAPNAVTFAGNIGATNGLGSISVGTDDTSAGNAVFSGSVAAATITAVGGNHANEDTTVTVATTLTATTLNVTGSAEANAAKTDFTVTGDITATTINVAGGANGAGTIPTLFAKGDMTVTTVNLDDNAASAFLTTNGTGDQTLTIGNIRGTGAADGTFQNSNTGGVVTVAGTIGTTATIEDITLDASTSTTFQSTVAIADDMAIGGTAGTTTLTAAVTVGDDLTIGDGATLSLASTLGSGDTVFTITNGGTDINGDDGGGNVTVKLPSNFTSGAINLLDDTATSLADMPDEFTATDTALTDYTVQSKTGDATIIEITAAAKSASAAAAALGVSEDAAVATQNAAIAFNGDATLRDLLTTALSTGGSTASEAAETLQGSPAAMTAAGSAAVTATGTQVIAVGSSRLASLRTGTAFASGQASGFAAGQDVLSKAIWFKPFVNFADQTRRKGIAGYDTETYGGALGGDLKIGDSTIGMSFSYANTDVDSKGTENAQTDIESYQGTMYADYTTSTYYVEALIGYARNEISTSRTITLNNSTASADYGSNQYMANIGAGMPVEVEEGHFITPTASFQYTLVENETYTETGAGVANLRVDQDEVHQALGIIGAKYHTHQISDSGSFTPEVHAALTYDFAGDDGVSTSAFNGGGAAFQVTGADVVEFGQQVGAGVSFMPTSAQGLTVSANYDFWRKDNFQSHSANFQLRLEF